MLLVATSGKGSFDRYSKSLAERISVPKLWTDVYDQVARRFGLTFWSKESWKSHFLEREFINEVKAAGASCVHLTNHHLARYGPSLGVPYIVTVHDTIRFLDMRNSGSDPYAQVPNFRDRHNLRRDIDGIKHAEHIIAVSEYTKQDLIQHCDIPAHRITVVYEAVDDELFRPVTAKIRDDDYILFVSTEYPRKNFEVLLEAFKFLKTQSHKLVSEVKIAKVGNPGGIDGSLRERSLKAVTDKGLTMDVEFLNFVSDEDLVSLYSHAKCLVMPSLYEGFGFPVLEAMACDCPVIASNTTSLKELVDGYGLLVDPEEALSVAIAIQSVLSDTELAESMRQSGRERIKDFSWEKTARETQSVYDLVEKRVSQSVNFSTTRDPVSLI